MMQSLSSSPMPSGSQVIPCTRSTNLHLIERILWSWNKAVINKIDRLSDAIAQTKRNKIFHGCCANWEETKTSQFSTEHRCASSQCLFHDFVHLVENFLLRRGKKCLSFHASDISTRIFCRQRYNSLRQTFSNSSNKYVLGKKKGLDAKKGMYLPPTVQFMSVPESFMNQFSSNGPVHQQKHSQRNGFPWKGASKNKRSVNEIWPRTSGYCRAFAISCLISLCVQYNNCSLLWERSFPVGWSTLCTVCERQDNKGDLPANAKY